MEIHMARVLRLLTFLFIVSRLGAAEVPSGSERNILSVRDEGLIINASIDCGVTDKIFVRFRLTNNSMDELTFREDTLPWRARNALSIAILDMESNTFLPASSPISDVWKTEVRVRPGKTVTGNVDLTDRVPVISTLLRRKPLIVFWAFQMKTSTKVLEPRFGGTRLEQGNRCGR
jgi:hypothetical protein